MYLPLLLSQSASRGQFDKSAESSVDVDVDAVSGWEKGGGGGEGSEFVPWLLV